MELKEFVEVLLDNTIVDNVLIFRCTYNGDFLFHQYINYYAKRNDCEIRITTDLGNIDSTSLFGDTNNILYVYEVEELKEDIYTTNNVWVKCKKVGKNVTHKVIELGKIEEWQIKDYIYSKCCGVDEKDLDYLCSVYKSNLYRLETEVDKISLFSGADRKKSYDIIKPQLYTDVSDYSIFDITNALIRRDKNELSKLYAQIDNIDVEPFGLVKLLCDNFKHIIDIQLSRNATPEYVGVSSKQFWAIKNFSCNHYTQEELVEIYKFVLDIDRMIKTGEIDTSLVNQYIINKIALM